jgi:hypothetical protein
VRAASDARAVGHVELEFRDGRVAASIGETAAGQTDSDTSDDTPKASTKKEQQARSHKTENKPTADQKIRTRRSAGKIEQDTNKDRQGQLF